MTTTWPRAILHLDMDAFFVNIHLLEFPEFKGLPIAIGGKPGKRGVISSASYEARRFGVRSAMPTGRAMKLCPNLQVFSTNWALIRQTSKAVMDILKTLGPCEPMSVDEAYVDLEDHPDPESTARLVREQVKAATGCPCSVGLATSKLVAKVASDYDKPEGMTVVLPGGERDFLAPLPVRAINGVGPKTAERLEKLGLKSCKALAAADPAALVHALGPHGGELCFRARGIDSRPIHIHRGPAKSISAETTYAQDESRSKKLQETLRAQAIEIADSLKRKGLVAHTVQVKLRWANFETITRQCSFRTGLIEARDLFQQARNLWRENWPREKPVRLLGLGVSGLQADDDPQFVLPFPEN